MKKNLCVLWILMLAFVGCGVRGKPLPPEKPPLLGRGEPSYSRATEDVDLPTQKKKTGDPAVKPNGDQP